MNNGTKIESSPADLGTLFLASASLFPDRTAVEVDGRNFTYKELSDFVRRLAAVIMERNTSHKGPVLLAASRSFPGYAGVLSSFLAGCGYVPINAGWPVSRIAWLFQNAQSRILIADKPFLETVAPALDTAADSMVIGLPDEEDFSETAKRWPKHRFFGVAEIARQNGISHSHASAEKIAYTIFTSGSTGFPKGVQISHAASLATNEAMARRYSFQASDRFTQLADFIWDPSVVDMFLAWRSGACVCCVPAKDSFLPDKFFQKSGATVIHLVPTTLRYLNRTGRLKPNAFPHLRFVFVGGEPFSSALAQTVQKAAPNAQIVNIYGSQEYSIFSTYDWNPNTPQVAAESDIVPLGEPFPNSEALILPEDSVPGSTTEGELSVSGPQMFSGYFQDASGTREVQFASPEGRLFYRMGDRVRRGKSSELLYLGRRDSLIKIVGLRIELGEIERALKRVADTESAVVLPWWQSEADTTRIVAFVSDTTRSARDIQEGLKKELPSYMLPNHLHILPEMPRNANGKCDRKALAERLNAPPPHA